MFLICNRKGEVKYNEKCALDRVSKLPQVKIKVTQPIKVTPSDGTSQTYIWALKIKGMTDKYKL